jgi:hypothetical protein
MAYPPRNSPSRYYGDRRRATRLPLCFPLRYKVLTLTGIAHVGGGQTCNVSSAGVLFQPDTDLAKGSTVEVAIDWPVLYRGRQHLELVLSGTIARLDDGRAALRISQYEFTPYRSSTDFATAAPMSSHSAGVGLN